MFFPSTALLLILYKLQIVYNPGPKLQGKDAALGIYLLFSNFSSCNCANRCSWAKDVSLNSSVLGMVTS